MTFGYPKSHRPAQLSLFFLRSTPWGQTPFLFCELSHLINLRILFSESSWDYLTRIPPPPCMHSASKESDVSSLQEMSRISSTTVEGSQPYSQLDSKLLAFRTIVYITGLVLMCDSSVKKLKHTTHPLNQILKSTPPPTRLSCRAGAQGSNRACLACSMPSGTTR